MQMQGAHDVFLSRLLVLPMPLLGGMEIKRVCRVLSIYLFQSERLYPMQEWSTAQR